MTTLTKRNIDNKIRTVQNIPVQVFDMSLTANKDIFLSLCGNTDNSLLTTKTGEVKTFLSVSRQYPRGKHVTKHNEIVLGVMKVVGTAYPTDKSCREVIIFGIDEKQNTII